MKHTLLAFILAASTALAACSSADTNFTPCVKGCPIGQTCDFATQMCVPQSTADGGAAATPAPPPALFALIDRMGRPAVNTALTNPYDITPAPGSTTPEAGDVTKDRYNADANQASWGTRWGQIIRTHLAILDGLDRNCGNQFVADATATRYGALAAVLADDQLVVDTSSATCNQYLGVEAGVAGDCGGRRLAYDVVDITYSALAAGVLAGVDDGIANDSTFLTDFPYLGEANH